MSIIDLFEQCPGALFRNRTAQLTNVQHNYYKCISEPIEPSACVRTCARERNANANAHTHINHCVGCVLYYYVRFMYHSTQLSAPQTQPFAPISTSITHPSSIVSTSAVAASVVLCFFVLCSHHILKRARLPPPSSAAVSAHHRAPDGRDGSASRSGDVELQGGRLTSADRAVVQRRRTAEDRTAGQPSHGAAGGWIILLEGT